MTTKKRKPGELDKALAKYHGVKERPAVASKKRTEQERLEANVVKAAMTFRTSIWFLGIYSNTAKGRERRCLDALDKACVMLNRHRLDLLPLKVERKRKGE